MHKLELAHTQQVEAEVVGAVGSGIKAAVWSPDEEQLVLVTGELYQRHLCPSLTDCRRGQPCLHDQDIRPDT